MKKSKEEFLNQYEAQLKNVDLGQEPFDIILVAGQSNAEGTGKGKSGFIPRNRVKMFYQKPIYDEVSKRIKFTGEYIFKNADLREGKYSSFFHEFANLYERNCLAEGRSILIINAAVGGTGFRDNYWKKGDILSQNTMQLVETALAANSQNKLVALLWHQGENDAQGGVTPNKYYAYLKELFETFRQRFASGEFPIVAGDFVERWKKTTPNAYKIAEATQEICRNFTKCGFVYTDGLRENGLSDIIHFSSKANKELAERYFEVFCRIKQSRRIIAIGDSITEQTQYVADLNALICKNQLSEKYDVISLGVSSETTSGLSEEGHPFVRPNVHNRISKVIETTKPDTAFLFYGVNDAIYQALSQERFDAYKDGMRRLVGVLEAAEIEVVILTPPYFDKLSHKGKLGNATEAVACGWIFEDYAQVMRTYADWIVSEFSAKHKVIDINAAMQKHINKQRELDVKYISGDGIHPNKENNMVIACEILRGYFGVEEDAMSIMTDKTFKKICKMFYVRDFQIMGNLRREIGHSTPYNVACLPVHKLRKLVRNINAKITRAVRRYRKSV